ncbi:sensor histidine kinase [Pedobacter aquatilis]|uniref:tetratricopeptide repeat-containing sensor histidine kinase n=1 Tax=Pedobacter aquatilis TaxID=351343 RepID=UPI002931DC08|nr:sensor histidine kinase [Pedobacter aquatilis]
MYRKILTLFYVLSLLGYFPAMARQSPERDSLLHLLKTAKADTNKVFLLIRYGQQLEDRSPVQAKQYYQQAGDLSRQLGFKKGIIKYIANYTYILNNVDGDYQTSIQLNLQALQLARGLRDSLLLAKTLFNVGTAYKMNSEFENAVKYYEEGKAIFEQIGDVTASAQGYDILQLLYYYMHQYERGIILGEKSVAMLRKSPDVNFLISALSNLGLNYSAAGKIAKARSVYEQALDVSIKDDNTYGIMVQYLNLGDLELNSQKPQKLAFYMNKALQLSRKLENYDGISTAYRGLAYHHFYEKDYIKAKQYADSAIRIANTRGLRQHRKTTLDLLAKIAYSTQNQQQGKYYEEQSKQLNDSLLNEVTQKRTVELEKKYELASKTTKIRKLESEKQLQNLKIQQRNVLIFVAAGGCILVLIIFLLAARGYRQKQKIQKQRISELEKERQLTATTAVLMGEEKERTRLARDLHDGLGGMLSGIKYSFQDMKGNLIMTPENQLAFERSMDMLDGSIKEMRRVAHNMMPEALVKFGLITAIDDFCKDINQTGALNINFQTIGFQDKPVEQSLAHSIYRVVQELINNILKHAGATTALVQLSRETGSISITVEDDGKGFNPADLKYQKGIGWENIQHRIALLNGKTDINSQPDKGTSILIEIPQP